MELSAQPRAPHLTVKRSARGGCRVLAAALLAIVAPGLSSTASGTIADLQATPGRHSMTLSWTNPSTCTEAAPSCGYWWRYQVSGATAWTSFFETDGLQQHVQAKLFGGTTYVFELERRQAGTVLATGSVSARVLGPPMASRLSADTPAKATIQLRWSSPGGGVRIDKYVLEVSEDGGATWTQLAVVTTLRYSHTGLRYSHTGLPGGASRHYRVKARNTDGGVDSDSEWSNVASATVLLANAARKPSNLTATGVGHGVRLSWDNLNDAAVTGYEYQQTDDFTPESFGDWTAIPGSGADTMSYTVSRLEPGRLYGFRIRGMKGASRGIPSASALARPTTAPAQPTGFTATGGNAQVALSWIDPGDSSIAKYQYLQKAGNAAWGTTWTDTPGSGATTISYSVNSLTNGMAYRFRIRAVNATGNGPPSDVAGPVTPQAFTMPPPETTPPTLERATVDGALLTLTFSEALSTTAPPAASRFRVAGTDVRSRVTAVAFKSPPWSTEVELTLSRRVRPGDRGITISYTQGSDANPLQDLSGNRVADFSGRTVTNAGAPPPDEEPPPAPEGCESRVTPYWHGMGGFAVRPTDGRSAIVRIECGGSRYSQREYAGEDGLIVRTVNLSTCTSPGRSIEGEMRFEGIDGDGWYWVNGNRNVALAPLVCESQLNPQLRPPVPDGVTARPSGDRRFLLSVSGRWRGTLMVHDSTGFMGIVPHLKDLEGEGEHVAPYWKGHGGIVGRPLNGESATVRLTCEGGSETSYTMEAGEDGIMVSLVKEGCYGADDQPTAGRLEVDGLEDGAWYWINGGRRFRGTPPPQPGPNAMAAAAPLVRRDADLSMLTAPVTPGGVNAAEGTRGTVFTQGRLMGVVPRLERIED